MLIARMTIGMGAVVLAACATTPPPTGKAKDVADAIYEYVVLNDGDYMNETTVRARSSCIQWPGSLDVPVKVAFSPWSKAAQASDISFPIGELAHHSLSNCERVAQENELDCDCQIIDRDGKNGLIVPEYYVTLLSNAPAGTDIPSVAGYDF